ncbi:MAG: GTP cyclohydrolase IIa, partial [Nitrosopumilaceae archaeon]
LYSKMLEFFLERKSMAFFLGGDNFMVIGNENSKETAKQFIDTVKKDLSLYLNCGIGIGKTSREAAKLATKSLDTIRQIRDSGKEKPEIFETSCF